MELFFPRFTCISWHTIMNWWFFEWIMSERARAYTFALRTMYIRAFKEFTLIKWLFFCSFFASFSRSHFVQHFELKSLYFFAAAHHCTCINSWLYFCLVPLLKSLFHSMFLCYFHFIVFCSLMCVHIQFVRCTFPAAISFQLKNL